MLLTMSGRNLALAQCAWCRCLIVQPDDETETALCVQCSMGFEEHPIFEDDTRDRIVDLQKLDVYSDSCTPTYGYESPPKSPRTTVTENADDADIVLPKKQPNDVLYTKIQECIVELPNRTAVPVESECQLPIVPSDE